MTSIRHPVMEHLLMCPDFMNFQFMTFLGQDAKTLQR